MGLFLGLVKKLLSVMRAPQEGKGSRAACTKSGHEPVLDMPDLTALDAVFELVGKRK